MCTVNSEREKIKRYYNLLSFLNYDCKEIGRAVTLSLMCNLEFKLINDVEKCKQKKLKILIFCFSNDSSTSDELNFLVKYKES